MAKKNETSTMSKDMIDNIKNYSSEIRTLKDFVEAVRQNPGYHLGSKGNKGYINMVREIIQNSLDELDKDSSPCTEVSFYIDERTYGVTCIDNGRGIPHGHILRIFTNPNTSSNYDKKQGEYSSGLHGVGSKVTNAMSRRFVIESYILGKAKRVEFTEGYPWEKGEVDIPNTDNKQGTLVYFEPSLEALGPVNVQWQEIYYLIRNIVPLSKIGAVVHFKAIDSKGKVHTHEIVNQDGIMTYIINSINTPLVKPIVISKDTGTMKVELAFTWDTGTESSDSIIAFANKCPTTLGTHIDGFVNGITRWFVKYMNTIYLASSKKNKITIISNDIKTDINAVVTVAHLYPIFDGQSKDKLANDDIEPFVRNTVLEQLDLWAKSNPKDLEKICKYIKSIAEIRLSTDKQKIKLSNNYSKSKLTNLPSKFVEPTGKTDLEFFIAEGDSAAGTMKNHRINSRQGYFPIRGKLPNAYNTARTKFLANAEVSGIIQIIGGGYGKDFDISKVKWSKIIIATDADADGDHIASLILRFFILYLPGLFEAGRVFRALPPLYGIKTNGKYTYLANRQAYVEYVQKDFSKHYVVSNITTKKTLTKSQLAHILFVNIDYKYELDRLSNNLAINPLLLETILTLHLQKASFSQLSKVLKKEFRFLENIKKSKDVIIIEGLVDGEYNTVFINDTLITEAAPVLEILNQNNTLVYNVNGKPQTIYEIMSLFDKSAPKSIQRYKGLGEMDGERLFDSTLDPTKRVLLQYTIEDAKAEVERIRYFENNTSELLTTTKLTRFDVLD